MNIKPILFSTPMVQAILAGRKMQTRRICMPLTLNYPERAYENETPEQWLKRWHHKAPYCAGAILWVRETFCRQFDGTGDAIEYKADWEHRDHKHYVDGNNPFGFEIPRWTPSIHMPKEAARIFLRVTDVRAERLRDISEKDAKAEGVITNDAVKVSSYVYWFQKLWDSINSKRGYGWDANPWVWVIDFERCDKPEGWPEGSKL